MSLNIVNKTTGALSQVAGNADDSGIGNLNSLTTTDKSSLVNAVNELKSGLTGLLKRGFFAITCTSGINILSRDTAVLHSGSLPTSDFTSCVFMVINHSTVQDAPNTVEADGGNTLIINAVSGQILSIVWLDFSNVPS